MGTTKTKAELEAELAQANKRAEKAEKGKVTAETEAAVAIERAEFAESTKGPETTVAEPVKKKRRPRRTLQERLGQVRAGGQLKEGEHMMDLVRYRNKTFLDQVVTTDDDRRVKLLGKGITDKSAVMADKSGDPDKAELVVFEGGTVVLTRKRGLELIAASIVEEVCVVDHANPDDYEEEE